MFIRPITVSKNGKRHGYWALVESYRTSRGPRQRVVSYLGQMMWCCRQNQAIKRRRCVSQLSDYQAILLQRLGLNLPKNLPLSGSF